MRNYRGQLNVEVKSVSQFYIIYLKKNKNKFMLQLLSAKKKIL